MRSIQSLARRVTRGSLTIGIFHFLALPLGYLVRVLYARSLNVEHFGLFYAVLGFLGLVSVLNDLGMSKALGYFIPRFVVRRQYGKVKAVMVYAFGMQLITALALGAFFWFGAPWLAQHYFRTGQAVQILRAFCLYFLFYNGALSLDSLFKGFQEERYYGSFNFVKMFVIALFSGAGFLLFKEQLVFVYALVWGLVYVLLDCVYFSAAWKKHKEIFLKKGSYSGKLFKAMLRYSMPIFLGSIVSALLLKMDVILLTWLKSVAIVGYYSIAASIGSAIASLVSPLSLFLFPFVAEKDEKKDASLKVALHEIYRFVFIFFLPLCLIFACFAQEVIVLLFSQRYIAAANALRILAVMALFGGLYGISNAILMGKGLSSYVMKVSILGGLVNLVLDVLLIPRFGAGGAAIATGFVWLSCFCAAFVKLRGEIALKKALLGKIGLAAGTATLLVFVLKRAIILNMYAEAVILGIVFIAVYMTMCLVLHVFRLGYVKKLIGLVFGH